MFIILLALVQVIVMDALAERCLSMSRQRIPKVNRSHFVVKFFGVVKNFWFSFSGQIFSQIDMMKPLEKQARCVQSAGRPIPLKTSTKRIDRDRGGKIGILPNPDRQDFNLAATVLAQST